MFSCTLYAKETKQNSKHCLHVPFQYLQICLTSNMSNKNRANTYIWLLSSEDKTYIYTWYLL